MNCLKECMNGDKLLDEDNIKYYSVEKNGKSFYLVSEIQSFLFQRGKKLENKKYLTKKVTVSWWKYDTVTLVIKQVLQSFSMSPD